MKKMSDVFEFPMNPSLHIEVARSACVHCKAEAAQHAVHAINHVDELADVIENVLHHHGHALSYEIKSWCVDALAAYRGEK